MCKKKKSRREAYTERLIHSNKKMAGGGLQGRAYTNKKKKSWHTPNVKYK